MRRFKDFIKKICWYLFRIFKIDNNKVVVDCFGGKGYFDNPKLVVSEMIKLNKNLKIICMISYDQYDSVVLPKYIKKVKLNSIKSIYEQATSRLWIGNSRKCYFTAKRKGQIYVQTWHGGIGIKKCEKDVIHTLSDSYINFAKKDAAITDYMIAGSKWQKELFERSFWYSNGFIEVGWPVFDKFLKQAKNAEIDKKYRKIFNISNDKKILLYCPTFRDDGNLECYDLDFKSIIDTFNKKDGSNWIVLIKLHPNMIDKKDYFVYSENVIDASSVGDIDELELFSDAMITDYSSTMFDFSIMKKPCYLYVNDYDDYIKERNFNMSFDSLPFPSAKTKRELNEIILNFDNSNYSENIDNYLAKLGLIKNPNSSKDVAKFILERMYRV